MKQKPFYITTTLPYVNAEPHIGHALEFVRADIIARYKKFLGFDVFFNTGTDEHGQKVYQKAQEAGEEVLAYAERHAERFKGLQRVLGLSEDIHFIRTTDEHHMKSAQHLWTLCDDAGYIYKKNYQSKYCVGCELEKTDSELEDGRCPVHPGQMLELIDEENYFFKFSEFQEKLLNHYKKNPDFVRPSFRFNEIKAFVERGLQDFSISRLKSKMPWGVPVPEDTEHVMYVWFDALANYITTLGWPEDTEQFNRFWRDGTPVQYAGKDNLRQQSAMWQAMLLAAGLPLTHTVVINGFINSGGQKMSKSIGNVINPYDIVEEYGTEVIRYFIARHVNTFEDSDVTMERFHEAYTAHLVNGLGNLTARIMKMAETHLEGPVDVPEKSIPQEFLDLLAEFEIQKAADLVWERAGALDLRIQETEPFKLVKTDKKAAVKIIEELARDLYTIGRMLNPLMPGTSATIKQAVKENKKPDMLFPRKD